MKRHWRLITILAAVAVAGLAVVALASAATTAPGSAGARGACAALSDNPEAVAAMAALRADMQEARQAWCEEYGDDRWSDEARAALQQLRATHWDQMRALLEKYDIEVPEGAGPGRPRRRLRAADEGAPSSPLPPPLCSVRQILGVPVDLPCSSGEAARTASTIAS